MKNKVMSKKKNEDISFIINKKINGGFILKNKDIEILSINEMHLITEEEKNTIGTYLKENPQLKYGIINDILFLRKDGLIYCKTLPFEFNGEMIETHNERFRKAMKEADGRKLELFSGVHMFVRKEEFKHIKNISQKRGAFKTEEHKKGDNFDNFHRIKTGCLGEYAVEKFTNIATTDFSNASGNSKDFLVADNTELNIGVKTCEGYNGAHVIENDIKHGEVMCTIVSKKNAERAHVVINGLAEEKDLFNKDNLTRRVLHNDDLLAKSLLWGTKIGFTGKLLKKIYSVNDINLNSQNTNVYKSRNIVINKNVRFTNLSEGFIETFEKLVKGNNSTIVYVHVNSIGFSSYKQNAYYYERRMDSLKIAMEEFAMKYRVGVVFYDDFVNDENYNYIEDGYAIGELFADGSFLRRPCKKEKQR